jgi:hypothetical protein
VFVQIVILIGAAVVINSVPASSIVDGRFPMKNRTIETRKS